MEKKKLYIPYGVKKDKEFFDGFGKRQIRHFLIGLCVTAAIALISYFLTHTVVVVIAAAIISLSADFMMTRKETYSQSIVDVIIDSVMYRRHQQRFSYIYDRDLEQLWKKQL